MVMTVKNEQKWQKKGGVNRGFRGGVEQCRGQNRVDLWTRRPRRTSIEGPTFSSVTRTLLPVSKGVEIVRTTVPPYTTLRKICPVLFSHLPGLVRPIHFWVFGLCSLLSLLPWSQNDLLKGGPKALLTRRSDESFNRSRNYHEPTQTSVRGGGSPKNSFPVS